MKTMLRIGATWEAWTSCSTISPADKLPFNPMVPVAQNVQPIWQPTFSSTNTHKIVMTNELFRTVEEEHISESQTVV